MASSLSSTSAARPSTSGGLATDRAGYVRAGYAEHSATGSASRAGGVATLSGGGAGLGSSATGFTPAGGSVLTMGDAIAGEEISTIFVVGFPEDMLE